MSKKVKALIVISFIFFLISVLLFVYSTALFAGMMNIGEDGTASGFGDAVGYAVLIIFFLIFMLAFAAADVINIVICAILIKLTAGKWRVYYIVAVSLSALMAAAELTFFLTAKK